MQLMTGTSLVEEGFALKSFSEPLNLRSIPAPVGFGDPIGYISL